MVWLQEQGDGLRVANTVGLGAERQRLVPSLLVGAPQIGKNDERELAFEVGKRMAYLRPERFVTLAVGTLPKLEAAFAASVLASGARVTSHDGQPFASRQRRGEEARGSAQRTRSRGRCSSRSASCRRKLSGRLGNGLISSLAHGDRPHGEPRRLHRRERPRDGGEGDRDRGRGLSSMSVKDRLRDLLAYSVCRALLHGSPPPRPPRPRGGVRVKASLLVTISLLGLGVALVGSSSMSCGGTDPFCGDKITQDGEQCDDGNDDETDFSAGAA